MALWPVFVLLKLGGHIEEKYLVGRKSGVAAVAISAEYHLGRLKTPKYCLPDRLKPVPHSVAKLLVAVVVWGFWQDNDSRLDIGAPY